MIITYLSYSTKLIEIKGTKCKKSECVLLKYNGIGPVFGMICDIILNDFCEPLLIVEPLETIQFKRHFHAYEVLKAPVRSLVVVKQQSDLADHHVMGFYQPYISFSVFSSA